jgi:hypothetical protein
MTKMFAFPHILGSPSSYMTLHLIYDFATAPFWISLYMRKILFSFYQCNPKADDSNSVTVER